jgi:hypothetical protein
MGRKVMRKRNVFSASVVVPAMAVLSIVVQADAHGKIIGPGDPIIANSEAPMKVGEETVAVVQPGTEFIAERVQGGWVSVSYRRPDRTITGWIASRHLVKGDGKLKLTHIQSETLGRNRYWWLELPQGVSHVLQIDSTYPVDLFVFSSEGKAGYEWAVNHTSGQATSYLRKWNVREAKVRWDPPDNRQYFLVIDNTSFPDGGARGRQSTSFSLAVWRDDPRPAEPIWGLGLIIGRVTLKFDGHEGRYERYAKPLTVRIAHKADGEDDSAHKVQEATTDNAGYFALGNLRPDRRYWVKEARGPNFTVPVPFRASIPIRSKDSDSGRRKDVLDIGHFALSVNSEGSVGVELTSLGISATKRAGQTHATLHFDHSSTLGRHQWFERTYAYSGWAPKVREDRVRIEKEREQNARGEPKRARRAESASTGLPSAPLPAPSGHPESINGPLNAALVQRNFREHLSALFGRDSEPAEPRCAALP